MQKESAFREMVRQYNEQLFSLRPPEPQKKVDFAAENVYNKKESHQERMFPSMAAVIGSPGRYVQGRGALKQIAAHAGNLGSRFLVLLGEFGRERIERDIAESFAGSEKTFVYENFGGECSLTEITRITEHFRAAGCDAVIGIGGGKILDTAKAAAHTAKVPVIIVPTAASTDAPCSALSVLYHDDGSLDRYLYLSAGPDMVLADTDYISTAPARLLVSGMGDALSTYFEARACKASGAPNCLGGRATLASMQLARLCYDTLLADGRKARLAAERKVCTPALENITETNIYLSGIGFESCGLAAAHAVHNGLTLLPETRSKYHGEKVAFGTLVQLVLENAPTEELETVLGFCRSVGLPVTLAELGIQDDSREHLLPAAERACADNDTMSHMPFPVTPEDVYAAMIGADALGKS